MFDFQREGSISFIRGKKKKKKPKTLALAPCLCNTDGLMDDDLRLVRSALASALSLWANEKAIKKPPWAHTETSALLEKKKKKKKAKTPGVNA